jgi:hypothetical protein
VIIRKDLPLGVQLAQTVHAAGESALLGILPRGTHAIVLAARDEAHFCDLEVKAKALGFVDSFVGFREPDAPYLGALMAIGFKPAPRGTYKKLLSQLPLVR